MTNMVTGYAKAYPFDVWAVKIAHDAGRTFRHRPHLCIASREAGLSAGMRRDCVPPPKKKKRKKA